MSLLERFKRIRGSRGESRSQGAVARIAVLEDQLETATRETARCRNNLEALLSISEATHGSLPMAQMFEQVLARVFQVTGFSAGAIRILKDDHECFCLVTQHGMNERMLQDLQHVPMDRAFQAEVARSRQPVFTSNLPEDPRVISPGEREAGYLSLICVPLLASSRLMGSMELAAVESRDWSEEEVRWLATIGRQIGTYIHLAQISEHSRSQAIIEERERLSHELHDGLTQAVGTLRIRTDEAMLCLEEEQPGLAYRALLEAERLARETYASLREEILDLRVSPIGEQDLESQLGEYLNRFQRQWGVETTLSDRRPAGVETAPEVEIQILRIVQEALNNVRRHARARSVCVSLEQKGPYLRVTIEDDGRGFKPGAVDENQLGLHIMRERAVSVGGLLEVDAAPGRGTRIVLDTPAHIQQSMPENQTW